MHLARRVCGPALLAAFAIGLAALAGALPAAHAQDVLPVPALSGRVIDQTGVLQPGPRQALEAKLEALERERGSQVVVLVVPSTQPEDIAAYAQRVGDSWKIGRRDVGDGLLIVVAVNDRRVNIQVAKALEGAIPDLAAKQIISNQIAPAFRAGDYAGGLSAAVDQIAARIGTEGLPAPPPAGPGDFGFESQGLDLQDLAIFLFVAVPIVATVLTAIFGRRLGSMLTAAGAGGVGWWFTASLLVAGLVAVAALVIVGLFGFGAARRGGLGGRGRGGGPPIIWGGGHHGGGWSSGGGGGGWGGGGGFGSGGGGDFGGGGASGDW